MTTSQLIHVGPAAILARAEGLEVCRVIHYAQSDDLHFADQSGRIMAKVTVWTGNVVSRAALAFVLRCARRDRCLNALAGPAPEGPDHEAVAVLHGWQGEGDPAAFCRMERLTP